MNSSSARFGIRALLRQVPLRRKGIRPHPASSRTLYIGLVAMLFAVPVGLFAAIYMSEYATQRVRSITKPLLEVLAGIPTIVYGFFALTTVGPFLRDISSQISD